MAKSLDRQILSIGVVDIGEHLPFKPLTLVRRLNRLQDQFRFELALPITSAVLGDPELQERAYDVTRLHDLLRQTEAFQRYDYLVGLTHVELGTVEPPTTMSGEEPKYDIPYFCLSDFSRVTVISTHHSVAQHKGSSVSVYQYVAYLLMCELLILLAKQDMTHLRLDECLFDDCVDRSAIERCIRTGQICKDCVATLNRRNVSDISVDAAKKVLAWTRRRELPFVLRFSFVNPVSTFFLGSLASIVLTPDRAWLVTWAAMIVIVGSALYATFLVK